PVVQPEPVVQQEPQVQTQPQQIQTSANNNYNEKVKSTNNYLKSITIDEEGLTPEFDKYTDVYYIIVPLTVNYISVDAISEDDNAKVSVSGNTDLQEGENTINITVTAENGNKRTYTINVTKTNDTALVNANLKELTIKEFPIEFDSNKYKYTIEIGEKQYNLNITAVTENDKATMVIEGNENFKNGENKVIIRVTAEDGTTQKEYIIYAIKDFSKVEVEKTNNNTKLIIIIICGTLFLICLITFICKIRKKY
ncbi:MAG: cadherin-like beta sandwich domain-containing protein, partial [Clostridia bacterium]|nr:cadherin-like beta sandwich domain-containing protein [Clostridia bacterium]